MDRSAPILVSACLLGTPCRYDGKSKADARVLALAESRAMIPVCPEQLGGLPTPRPPAERRGGQIVALDGADVTDAFARGAEETLRLARLFGCQRAILKARSPSCGRGRIYNGSFTGKLVSGDGVAAALLTENGVEVYGEEDDLAALL